ncbi:MAG TPA: hypothetical protein VH418_10005 [Solirubrobacteraceae bacterium]|jgi:hypothetical protein
MFRRLAASIDPNPDISGPQVFALHPMQLARYLEEAWINKDTTVLPGLKQLEVPSALRNQEATSFITPPLPPGVVWDHLIYAYMVENTRVYEIFQRVLEEYVYGERLGTPSDATHAWLRTTEQLFYGGAAPWHISSLTSRIRHDERAGRRNVYHRMFGMDLNHGTDDNRPYPYPRAAASNTEFVPTWEQFLREVWQGIENFSNQTGAKPTDDAAIANLARTLDDMLSVRRDRGNLLWDELQYVSTFSWFHLTLSFNSPVVVDLQAEGNAPEERLLKIGRKVNLAAHSLCGAHFRLADATSFILRGIEAAQYNSIAGAQTLYDKNATPPDIFNAMDAIIRDWSIATGRDMKAHRVAMTTPQAPRPRPHARPPVGANGHRPATPDVVHA